MRIFLYKDKKKINGIIYFAKGRIIIRQFGVGFFFIILITQSGWVKFLCILTNSLKTNLTVDSQYSNPNESQDKSVWTTQLGHGQGVNLSLFVLAEFIHQNCSANNLRGKLIGCSWTSE